VPVLAHEGESQQARAEQDKAGSGQREEAVGYEIMMAHVTPSFSLFRRSSELIKTFGTSPTERGDAEALLPILVQLSAARDQARDSTPSNAWAMKIPAPTSPITAVTISNIANILCAPHEANDAQPRTVKEISGALGTIGGNCGFSATAVPNQSRRGLQE